MSDLWLPEEAAMLVVLHELRDGSRRVTDPPLTEANSGIQPLGQAIGAAGEFWVAVDEGGESVDGSPRQDHLKTTLTIEVTISRRLRQMPRDRAAANYLQRRRGLAHLQLQIIRALHGNFKLLTEINKSTPSTASPFEEPLWFAGAGKTRVESGLWSAEDSQGPAWYVRTLRFVGLRRTRCNVNLE